MPLLDHFHPPLSEYRHWQAIHSAWANTIAFQLNEGLLPPRYFAEATISWGRGVEVDVATIDYGENTSAIAATTGSNIATAVWSPARPAISIAADFADAAVAEVRVFNDEEGPQLVAAVELVSLANKERPATRDAFARKCAAYIQDRIGLVIIDSVTERRANMHEAILQTLGIEHSNGESSNLGSLYAAAYRIGRKNREWLFQAWPEKLEVGLALPTLPLWVNIDLALPLDLERSYCEACRRLRIRK